MLTGVVGGLIGGILGPSGAATGAFIPIAAIEKASFYEELLNEGIDPNVATKASTIYGTVSALIENSGGYTPASIAKMISSGGKEIFKQS
jgi:hypothetical protein